MIVRLLQYKYFAGALIGACLLVYGAFLIFKGDIAGAQAYLIWGSSSMVSSLLLRHLLARKTK
jgi:hypothetical protein